MSINIVLIMYDGTSIIKQCHSLRHTWQTVKNDILRIIFAIIISYSLTGQTMSICKE
jgi:hypothetical protein